MYQPKTGAPCGCKRGQQRDNCPQCEGTGQRIDFAAIRARGSAPRPPEPVTVVDLPQSTGETLYGAHVGGYVVAHGYRTAEEARASAEDWARKNAEPDTLSLNLRSRGITLR